VTTEGNRHEPSALSPPPDKRRAAARTLITGAAVACVAALAAIVPRIGGIDTWKIVLGLAGLALFIGAGREPRKS
jgi:hypothetical protein